MFVNTKLDENVSYSDELSISTASDNADNDLFKELADEFESEDFEPD